MASFDQRGSPLLSLLAGVLPGAGCAAGGSPADRSSDPSNFFDMRARRTSSAVFCRLGGAACAAFSGSSARIAAASEPRPKEFRTWISNARASLSSGVSFLRAFQRGHGGRRLFCRQFRNAEVDQVIGLAGIKRRRPFKFRGRFAPLSSSSRAMPRLLRTSGKSGSLSLGSVLRVRSTRPENAASARAASLRSKWHTPVSKLASAPFGRFGGTRENQGRADSQSRRSK